ncbi:AI-2E family transporter [Deinococcus aquaedulcis]|uniref:AI-2E family transporter n=1 Tax=Deinococcus aquaedulcis TaxID=2840455 RepID=UPI001C83E816|nr:AI-2E family transporter [Deinococcus aquaedulcis]
MTLPDPGSRTPLRALRDAPSVPELLRRLWGWPVTRLLAYLGLAWLALRVVTWTTHALASVIVTVVVAYALAFLVNPLLAWLERRRVSRGVGVLLLVTLFAGLLTLLVATLTAQLRGLVESLPYLSLNLKNLLNTVLDWLARVPGTAGLRESLTRAIDEQTARLTTDTGPILERLVNSGPDVLGTLSSLVGWLGQVAFIITLALYFMFEYQRFGHAVMNLFPRRWQPTLYTLTEDISESFGLFLRGSLLTTLSCAVLATGGLLALGIPNALALGLLSALLNLVPYLGIVAAAALPMLEAIPQGSGKVGAVAVLYFLLNQLLGNVIGPIIMGRSAQLSPAAVLIALLVGLALAGVVGAILAIPLSILVKRWTERYWLRSNLYRGEKGMPAPAHNE